MTLRAAALSTARRTESTRLICPAPTPTVASPRASTIALERTCLHTRQANSISLPLVVGGLALGHHLHRVALLEP